jgi:hypothetical protein
LGSMLSARSSMPEPATGTTNRANLRCIPFP